MKKNLKTENILLKVAVVFMLLQYYLLPLSAQQRKNTETVWLRESVHLHLPVRGYTPGDLIWFKLYVTDEVSKRLSEVSKVAYVELVDDIGEVAWQSKLAIEKGTGNGSWRIPASLSTGVYYLRSYTRQQLQSGVPIELAAMTILNPLKGLQRPFRQPQKADTIAVRQKSQLTISGLKENYHSREVVQLSISGADLASVAVAVYQSDSLETLMGEQVSIQQEYRLDNPVWVTEYGGHLISGNVSNRNGQPLEGIRVYLSIPGKRFFFNSSVSDAAGRVQFEVQDIVGTTQLIVYPASTTDSGVVITLDNPFLQLPLKFSHIPIVLGEAQKKSFDERTTEHSLRELFQSSEHDQYYSPWQGDTTAFFGVPDKVYLLDDYTRFTTLEEVFREYVPEVDVRKVQGEFGLRMLNQPFRRSFDGNPLVLLDGVVITDMNKLMAIDPLKIKKLELVTRRYYLGDLAFEGILSLTTYEGDLGGFKLSRGAVLLDYSTMQLQQQFSSPMYNTEQTINTRTPDLRNVLLWEPDATADAMGKIPVLFYTGDLSGQFVVDVKGYAANGQLIHERQTFLIRAK